MNKIIEVLKIINDKLKGKNIKWVISGSTSLFLQGIKVKPHDIDIMTDKEGAFKIYEELRENGIQPVKFSRTDILSSYFGKLDFNGVEIDIMGEFSEKIGNKWVNVSNKRLKDHLNVRIDGIKLPVSKLEHHLESYKVLKRKKDINKIKELEGLLEN